MATDAFEMETGVPFVPWIEKHPDLTMQHQPMEMHIRRMGFVFPFVFSLASLLLLSWGGVKVSCLIIPNPPVEIANDPERVKEFLARHKMKSVNDGLAYMAVGAVFLAMFAGLSFRQGKSYWRARDFKLTLKDGVFQLSYGPHNETFTVDDVKQACIVRPGTVGASEGALGLADGRMLTLDTCLSDLHALGVVMDLRFREDFPPSQEDLARDRRNKLRKIRGLS